MIATAHLLTMLERRAQRTLSELAAKAGLSDDLQLWAKGTAVPTLEQLQQLARAGELDLSIGFASADDSLERLVDDQLRMGPPERLAWLLPRPQAAACLEALAWVAAAGHLHVLIGPVAGVLQGAPQRPFDGTVDVVPAPLWDPGVELVDSGAERQRATAPELWRLPEGGLLRVHRTHPPGTWGYLDLARDASSIALDSGQLVRAASLIDLLRIAMASSDVDALAVRAGLRAALARSTTAAPEGGQQCGSCGAEAGVRRPSALFRRGWSRHGGPADVWVCPACADEVYGPRA